MRFRTGERLIFSNPPQLYNELAAIGNTESITGLWTFASSTIPQVSSDTTNAQDGVSAFNLATVGYVNSTTIAGAPNGSLTVKGIYQEATPAQIASGTAIGSTGADLIIPNRNSCITASTTPCSVISSSTIDPSFLLNGNYKLGSTTIATGTFPNQTSSLLITNASGTVGGFRHHHCLQDTHKFQGHIFP